MYFTVFTHGPTAILFCLSVVYYNYWFVCTLLYHYCTRSVSETDGVVKDSQMWQFVPDLV